jgi:type II secretory pathway component PulF
MVTPGQLNRRAELFEQLAAMIAAGLPLTRALEMAAKNRSLGVPRKVLQGLIAHLQEGHTFADATQLVSGQKRLQPEPGIQVTLKPNKAYWLSEFDIALLTAGEESGRLDATFKLLGRYYASRAKMIRDTVAGMIVSIANLHVFLLIFPLGLLIAFVIGFINNQYALCLPFLIEKTVVFGAIYGVVSFLIFACEGNRGEGWRAMVESIFSIGPLLRTAVKYLAVSRLAMSLDSLLNAGVPVIKSWNLSAAACGSPHLKREILKWSPELETGMTPAEMVERIKYFPDMFAQLYQTGELSGRTDESLQRLHTYFEEEGFRKLQAFCRILNFLIYFTIAITIAIFVITFWKNYYGALLNSV